MRERRGQITLEQIRALRHFDISTLAEQAGVETVAVYHALIMKPIFTKDAERIITALSEHIGMMLRPHVVDIITWEEFLILWIIRASASELPERNPMAEDKYHFVYARDRKHAILLAQPWLEHLPDRPYHYFTAYPEGFVIENIIIPGRLEPVEG